MGVAPVCLFWFNSRLFLDLQSMSDFSVSTFQLNELSVHLSRMQALGACQLEVLERGVAALAGTTSTSSEVINAANQIWLVIHQLPVQPYWTAISYILTHATHQHSRTLALSSIAKRLQGDWPSLQEDQRKSIASYLLGLESEGTAGEAVVGLLRVEWRGLLNGFIARMAEELDKMPVVKLVANIELLRKVLREGFEGWGEETTTEEALQFRLYVEGQMRAIMQIVCFCVSNSAQPDAIFASLCLVREVAGVVPVFQLFNCDLLEGLASLLGRRDFGREAMVCLREIFGFREGGESPEHYSKIARRLFGVLEREMGRVAKEDRTEPRRAVNNFDKQSASTADSFGSRQTRGGYKEAKFRSGNYSGELIELLYLYLARYVPTMGARPDERHLEIQSDRSTKLFFSQQLYDYFAMGYWRLVSFVVGVGRVWGWGFGVLSEAEQQREYMYLICVKLLLGLFCKLGLSEEKGLKELVEILVVRLAPLEKPFRKFYVQNNALVDQRQSYFQISEVRHFSEEYCRGYLQSMGILIKDQTLLQIYIEVMDKLLERAMILEQVPLVPLNQNQNVVAYRHGLSYSVQAMNLVNRIAWSFVCFFRAGGEITGALPASRLVSVFLQRRATADTNIKKCYTLNSKYLLQAFKGTQYFQILFSSFATNSSDWVHQCNILVLSRILLHPDFGLKEVRPDWGQGIEMLLARVAETRQVGTYGTEFHKIYPAIFRLCSKLMIAAGQDGQMMAVNVKDWLGRLIYSEVGASVAALRQDRLEEVGSLKRVVQVLCNLEDIAGLILQMRQMREKEGCWILKHHLAGLKHHLASLQFKYKLYSDYLHGKTLQNFQVSQIMQFRNRFSIYVANFARLLFLRSKIQASNQTVAINQKGSVTNRLKFLHDGIQMLRVTEGRLFEDFEMQQEFKCPEYIGMVLEYYKLLMLYKGQGYEGEINGSITAICDALEQPGVNKVETIVVVRVHFWRELVEHCLFELDYKNCQRFCQLYSSFIDFSAANVQGCLEVMQRVLQKLSNEVKESRTPQIWKHYISLFKISFQHLFDDIARNEQVFKRLAHIFYAHLVVADGAQWNLRGQLQGTMPNIDVLFVFVRDHVRSTLGAGGEEHELALQALFKERRQERFLGLLKDYKVGLMHWLNNASHNIYQ